MLIRVKAAEAKSTAQAAQLTEQTSLAEDAKKRLAAQTEEVSKQHDHLVSLRAQLAAQAAQLIEQTSLTQKAKEKLAAERKELSEQP